MVEELKREIESLKNSFNLGTPSTTMDSILEAIRNTLKTAQREFECFLNKLNSMGSIQFLLTGEGAFG